MHNYLLTAAASYSQQEELQSVSKHLQKSLQALLDSQMSYFYSIPPQSVIHIGSSTYKGQNSDVKITDYPLLIADLRAATNYFMIRAQGEKLEQLTQSPLGEGSFITLAKLLSVSEGQADSVSNLVAAGIYSGNNLTCDLLVADIYGEAAKAINLPGEIIASCFGKPDHSFSSREDKIKSLILMHCLDICNVAGLLCRIHQVKHAIFLLPNLETDSRGGSIESYISTSLSFLWPGSEQHQTVFLGSAMDSDERIESKYLTGIGLLL